jgi:mercuric ion binding protein
MIRGSWLFVACATFVLLGALPAATVGDPLRAAPRSAAVQSGPQRIELVVTGLTCPFCAYGIEKRLRRLEGLDSLAIDFRTGRIILHVRDGSVASDDRLRQLVRDAGFALRQITRAPLSPTRSGT